MDNKNTKLAITEESLNSMISTLDFSGVEENIPELVAYLLQSAPPLMQSAFKVALENDKIRAETCKYIHATSTQVLTKYSDIVKLEQQSLKDNTQKLGEVLIQLTKKSELTAEEIQMYFTTLQQIEWNNKRMAESVTQSQEFIEEVQIREIEETKPKDSVVLKAIVQAAQTPEGSKLLAEGLFFIGKALYNSYILNSRQKI